MYTHTVIQTFAKQVMHNGISYHLLIDAQPVPVQCFLPLPTLRSSTLLAPVIKYGIYLRPVWVGCPDSVLSQHLVPPLLAGQHEKHRNRNTPGHAQYCSAATKTSVHYQHCSFPKAKLQHHIRQYEENQLCLK